MKGLLQLLVFYLMWKNTEAQFTIQTSNETSHMVVNTGESSTRSSPVPRRRLHCAYAPGLAVGNRDWELRCCAYFERLYEVNWASLNQPLSRHLEALKGWNCPQFEAECKRRLFATTDFTKLLYDYFCDRKKFVSQCFDNVNKTITASLKRLGMPLQVTKITNISIGNVESQWQDLKSKINISQLTTEELLLPCFQVAQYDMEEVHNGDFQELSSIEIPSCQQVWCGVSGKTLEERVISLWSCMSSSCHAKIIIIMVACGIMALAIAIVNFSVIVAIVINPPLQHSQSTYKISLAVADLLVGVVVLPTCISNLARLVWTQHVQEGFYNVEGYEIINGTLSEYVTIRTMRDLSGKFSEKFPPIYLNSIGFFTAVSVFVSVYTLAGAGFDRLIAVFRPLSYRKDKANRVAKWTCVLSWALALVFASLSFFLPSLSYNLIHSVLILNGEQYGIYLYTAGFIVPLIIVWVVNILTFKETKKHSSRRKKLTSVHQRRTQKVENRLAHTLALMVGVFSINTMPLIILLACSIFLPSIVPTFPRTFSFQLHFDYAILQFVAIMLLFSNSFWNFFIYSFRNRDFRTAVRRMYRNTSHRIGVSSWLGSTVSRFRRMAHDGRRRLSSLPTLSTQVGVRKKSSVPSLSSQSNETCRHTNDRTRMATIRTTTNQSSSISEQSTIHPASRYMESTFVATESITSNEITKKNKKHNNKQEESSYAGDDSIFRSFAVDANADRLFESVMENIDENVTAEEITSSIKLSSKI